MKAPIKVLHLVDDTTAGGVMRVVDFILQHKGSSLTVKHERLKINRGEIKVTRYNADIIVSHLTISWRTIPALIILRVANFGKKLIHVEHSYTEGFIAHNVDKKRRFMVLLRLGFSIFNKIVAVSYAQEKWFRDQAFCTSDKITAIQSCVDLEPFRALPDRKNPTRVFAAIGRLDRQKGFDNLILAFKTYTEKNIGLHIYGEGDEEISLRELAAEDSRIVFKGFAPNPKDAFLTADVVIMPSRWEAYGLVAIEALSAGCELICTDVDGLSDHRELGATILDENTIDGIRDAIAKASYQIKSNTVQERERTNALESQFFHKWEALIT